jgi:hypothetical protein
VRVVNNPPQTPQKVGTKDRSVASPVDVLSIWQADSNDSMEEAVASGNDSSMGDETAMSQNSEDSEGD